MRRRAGVCLHLTSLPGDRGIGEIGAKARHFMDWMQARGLSVWQFLPTGPTGFRDSPYQPLSVFAGNPLLIDLDLLVDWELLQPGEARGRFAGPPGQVDFGRVMTLKETPLALAADRLLAASDSGLRAGFDAFVAANGEDWLDAYAAFTVLKAVHRGLAWPRWAGSDARFDAGSIARCAREHGAAWQRVRAVQFLFQRQWRALHEAAAARGIVLFGDVPIYMALDCAEAWARPDLLMLDGAGEPLERAGVPPDYFSADGQLWGNPVYRWEAHAGDGYRWWIARLKHALTGADLLRLDHFRGFDEYWSVPSGAVTAREGRWRPGPSHALFAAVDAALGRVPCVAEDLGVITESVVALRKAYALPGMRVLQFLLDRPDYDPGSIEEDCVCYTGTHDNDTALGWFGGGGGQRGDESLDEFRRTVVRNLDGDGEDICKSMINHCFQSRSRIAVAPLQDYLGLGSEARLNRPGQADGNWRWRVTEAGLDDAGLADIGDAVRRSGRQ